jgi:hypothetical protein
MRLGWVVASGALTLGLVACGSGGDDDGGGGSGGQAATTPTTGLAVLGETFEDPEGSYEIEVDPDWEAHHGEIAEGVEV